MSYIESKQKLHELLLKKIGDENLVYDLSDKIIATGNKFEISFKEIGEIIEVIYKVLSGEVHREQFFENLQKIEDLVEDVRDEEELRQIATLIDDAVLSQIKKYIGSVSSVAQKTRDQEKIESLKQDLKQNNLQQYSAPAPRQAAIPNEIPQSTRREIDELKEKLRRLEDRSGEYSPTFSGIPQSSPKPKPEVKPATIQTPTQRFGVEPAKDLGAEDFDWKGNVGGVEIEQNQNSESVSDEELGLDKAQVLEEVENPPAYNSQSALEKKLGVITQPKPEPKAEKTQESYKGNDPYREPIL